MPSTLPPARALRALLRTPATTRSEENAVVQSTASLSAALRAQAESRGTANDQDLPLLLQEMIGLGPQLQALGAAMSAQLGSLPGGKRSALLQQQDGALYLLSVLWPSAFIPGQDISVLRSAFTSLAWGTCGMLAASAATLAAPRQAGEQPHQLRERLRGAAQGHLEKLGRIAAICSDMDAYVFEEPAATQALAQHALNHSIGLSWMVAATAALAGSGSGSSPPVDLPTADVLARLLILQQATALRQAVRAEAQLQPRLLQLLLPALLQSTAASQRSMRPFALPSCAAALCELAPDAIAAHMASPAGLRSLRGASQQLQQLQQERREQQREQRRQQRRAAPAGQQAGQPEGQDPILHRLRSGRSELIAALRPLAWVRLIATLVAAALPAAGSSSERAAVVCRLLEGALPAIATAVQESGGALPHVSGHVAAWGHGAHALLALGQALQAAALCNPPPSQHGFDSSAAALLAALQLRALLCGLLKGYRAWQLELLQAGRLELPDVAISQHIAAAAQAAESYALQLARHIFQDVRLLTEQVPGRSTDAELWSASARASHQLEAVARAHASCASLLHLLTAEVGSDAWNTPYLPATLQELYMAAGLLGGMASLHRPSAAAELALVDSLVLAHFTALRLAVGDSPHHTALLRLLSEVMQCPPACVPVAAAAGAASVQQAFLNLQRQGQADAPEPPLLAALRAEERRQAEAGPAERAALALRVERAKALRPCASLACPHLAANPQLRGKACSGCRTLRYCCAEDQAQDWKAGGHRAACRLLHDAGGGASE